MIERIPALWALRGWAARRMEEPRVYSAVQRAFGSRGLWTRFVAEALRPRPGMRVLDVGCGPADVLAWLPEGVTYVGVDVHAPYLARALDRWGARGRFHEGPVEALPSEAPFDVALFAGVLHHLDDAKARSALAAARARLAPRGRIVGLEPLRRPGQGALERQLYAIDRGRHVRDAEGYAALFDGHPVDARPWPGLLRLPYTYVVLESPYSASR